MSKIDRNVMAEVVTGREGKHIPVNIAQVKEVQRNVLEYLSDFSIFSVWRLLHEVRKERSARYGHYPHEQL